MEARREIFLRYLDGRHDRVIRPLPHPLPCVPFEKLRPEIVGEIFIFSGFSGFLGARRMAGLPGCGLGLLRQRMGSGPLDRRFNFSRLLIGYLKLDDLRSQVRLSNRQGINLDVADELRSVERSAVNRLPGAFIDDSLSVVRPRFRITVRGKEIVAISPGIGFQRVKAIWIYLHNGTVGQGNKTSLLLNNLRLAKRYNIQAGSDYKARRTNNTA